MKEPKARYTVCSIVTADKDLLVRSNEIRAHGYTHEDIYRKGVDIINAGMGSANIIDKP